MLSLSTPKTSPLILLIEDEVVMRTQMRMFLQKEKYQVIEAGNGQEGIDACKRLKPDMVLLDAVMPVMDGFACCAQIQSLPKSEFIPILMITGLGDSLSVDRAFDAGAIDYVTKPIHWPVLRQRVRRLIQQSQLLQELEVANQQLKLQASTDSLTQLANRRQFDHQLEQEWRRMAREQAPLSLILCDVDFFKGYNDTLGHTAGDKCLRQVAKVIQNSANRPGDLAARYGGEEFAVILSKTDQEGAIRVAEKAQARLRAMQLPHPGSAVSSHVTVSLGIATAFPHQLPDFLPEALITAADKALYEAKAAGRNRFSSHTLT